ncbi:hypothetical protein D9M68_210510 [compost metagenome]
MLLAAQIKRIGTDAIPSRVATNAGKKVAIAMMANLEPCPIPNAIMKMGRNAILGTGLSAIMMGSTRSRTGRTLPPIRPKITPAVAPIRNPIAARSRLTADCLKSSPDWANSMKARLICTGGGRYSGNICS